MKQIKKTKKAESGRSMIEMVGVLAVMGLITAGAFVLISSAMSSQKISRVDDDVSAIVAGIRLLYNTSENFNGISTNSLTTLGFTSANPYGGTYTVGTQDGTTTTAASARFTITISGLSGAQCNSLKARNWPGNPAAAVTSSPATCNGAGSANSIIITYGKNQ